MITNYSDIKAVTKGQILEEIGNHIIAIADLLEEQQQDFSIRNTSAIIRLKYNTQLLAEETHCESMDNVIKEINNHKVKKSYEIIKASMGWK